MPHDSAGFRRRSLAASLPHRRASDSQRGRERAQQCLVLSLASLAKAGIEAVARVGDEDVVQTTEDELQSFPATEVILVTGAPEQDTSGDAAAAELEFRLLVPSAAFASALGK
jgi:hypothetical protein